MDGENQTQKMNDSTPKLMNGERDFTQEEFTRFEEIKASLKADGKEWSIESIIELMNAEAVEEKGTSQAPANSLTVMALYISENPDDIQLSESQMIAAKKKLQFAVDYIKKCGEKPAEVIVDDSKED